MRPASSVRTIAAIAALVGPVALAATFLARSAPSAEASDARVLEVTRIRAHFDSVLAELPTRDVSSLSTAQRARRAGLMRTLHAYRDAGVFPHNYDFAGRMVPYFVDRKTGTLCAVAHLLATSGRRDIVDRVARADNNVYVASLASDTAFTHWLDASGLTLAEAARIQVPYSQVQAGETERATYALGTVAGVTGSVLTSLVNLGTNRDGHGKVRNVLGVAFGGAAIGFGGWAGMREDNVAPIVTTAVGVGLVSTAVAVHGFTSHHRTVVAQRNAARATVMPIIPVDGKSGTGLQVALRF